MKLIKSQTNYISLVFIIVILISIVEIIIYRNIPKSIVSDNTKHSNIITNNDNELQVETDISSTLDKIVEGEYNINLQKVSNLLESPNRANNMRISYSSNGFEIKNRVDSTYNWNVNFSILGIYRGETLIYKTTSAVEYSINENQVVYNYCDFDIQYINNVKGMQQNFIVKKKPEGMGPLAIKMDLHSDNLKFTCDGDQVVGSNGTEIIYQYSDLKVWDANSEILNSHMALVNNQLSLIVDDSHAVFPLTIDPVSATPDVTLEGDQNNAWFGRSVASAGDVNNDGYDDIIVGAHYYDNGEVDEGRAYIYHGSATGINPIPATILESNQESANYGNSVSTAGDVNGDGYDDIIVGSPFYNNGQSDEGVAFVYHGSEFGIISTPAVILECNQAQAYFGWCVSNAGDVNNDGFDDVIIGAYRYDNGQDNEGRAYVFHGSAIGINSVASTTKESGQVGAYMGYSVSDAGDVNNDGFDDVIIGVVYYDFPEINEGRAYIYHGSPTGIGVVGVGLQCDQAYAEFSYCVSSAGDLNGDGFSDVVVGAFLYDNGETDEGGAFVYNGSPTGINPIASAFLESNQQFATFGYAVSNAGDVNGDDFDDLLIGSIYYDNGQKDEGKAYLYQGSASGINIIPVTTFEGDQDSAYFGTTVAGAGDLDGDGLDDIIIGAWKYSNDQIHEGRALIYYGNSCTNEYYEDADGDGFGNSAELIMDCIPPLGYVVDSTDCNDSDSLQNPLTVWYADMDGDDYFTGTGFPITQCNMPEPGYSFSSLLQPDDCNDLNSLINPGLEEFIDGIDNNCNDSIDENSFWTFGGILEYNQDESSFGNCVSSAGDVNGDGFEDMIVSAYLYDNGEQDEGMVFIYHGSSSGISLTPNTIIEGNQISAWFGFSVSSAGDVNGDGYDDIIIGAHGYDNGQLNEGRCYIFHGSPSGINTIPIISLEINQVSANFGYSVSSAGDVNGDGYDDIILSAPYFNGSFTDEGKVYIYHGSAIGINAVAAITKLGGQSNANFGISISEAGDVNNDGYDDILIGASGYDNGQTNEGRAYIFHGSSSGINPIAATVLESDQAYSDFGESVSEAGDVNGDGYSDILVGAHNFDDGETSEGAVFAYHGSSVGVILTPNIILESNQISANFGVSVSSAGDINEDGYFDIIVGADYYDNDHLNEGSAFVYFGSASGLLPETGSVFESNQEVSYFGISVAHADLNGDGYHDIFIGANQYDKEQPDEGAVFFYYSAPCLDIFYEDVDVDGFGDLISSTIACSAPIGYVSNADDCNDLNDLINPLSPELCNSLDDNCNGLIDDAITETISIAAGGPITFCQGGNVLLTATYSGATVQWKKNGVNIPGATSPTYLVTTKATYTCVTISPCGTATSTGIFVNVNKNPAASITAGGATTFCAGGSVILTANAGGGLSYQWYKGASLIAGATSINYTATITGNYKCRVTKTATGCFKNSNVIGVSVPCREGELLNDEDAFIIYPNPNDGTFKIEANVMTQDFASPESAIEIYNNLGQLIYFQKIYSQTKQIELLIYLNDLSYGIYLVRLINADIISEQKLFIN